MSKATAVVLAVACFVMAALLLGALVGVLRGTRRAARQAGMLTAGASAPAAGSAARTSTGGTSNGRVSAGGGVTALGRGRGGATSVSLRERLQRRVGAAPAGAEELVADAAATGHAMSLGDESRVSRGDEVAASVGEEPTEPLGAPDAEAAEPTRPVERRSVRDLPTAPGAQPGSVQLSRAQPGSAEPGGAEPGGASGPGHSPLQPSDPDRAGQSTTDGE